MHREEALTDPLRLVLDDGTDRELAGDRVWNVYRTPDGITVCEDSLDGPAQPLLGRILHFGQWVFRASDAGSAALVRINGRRPPAARVVAVPGRLLLQYTGRSASAGAPPRRTASTGGGATGASPDPAQTPQPATPSRTAQVPALVSPQARGPVLVIGRLGTDVNGVPPDIALADPRVLARHATAHPQGNGDWIVRPARGLVFVNGRQVARTGETIRPGGRFIVGQTVVTVPRPGAEPGLQDSPDPVARDSSTGGGLSVRAEHLHASYGDDYALRDVTFTIGPGELVSIVGPSGAGKSTLIWAMMGGRRLIEGQLFIGDEQIHPTSDPRMMRRLVRLVPQDDHLYPTLTLRQTLTLAALLRWAPDSPRGQVDARVDQVMAQLQLENLAGQKISELSGGQRRRASIGVELVGRPQLLLLDEPTSGLDLGKDRRVMGILRAVADGGCTVVVVTHNVAHLDESNQVMVVARGGTIYTAPSAAEMLRDRAQENWPDLLDQVEEFRPTPVRREHAARLRLRLRLRLRRTVPAQDQPAGAAWRDLRVLVTRQLWLLARRGWKSSLTLLTMPLIGAALAVVAAHDGLRSGAGLTQVIAIMTTIAALTGAALSYQDIVEETGPLRRDWRVGTATGSIVTAKSLVYLLVCAVLSMEMTGLFAAVRPWAPGAFSIDPWVGLTLVWFLVMSASMCFGLLVSAVSPTLERAVAVNTVLAILQVVLNGSLFKLPVVLAQAALVLPARLGYAAVANYTDLNTARRGAYTDPLWDHSVLWFWVLQGALVLSGVVATRLAVVLLERNWRRAEWLVEGKRKRRPVLRRRREAG